MSDNQDIHQLSNGDGCAVGHLQGVGLARRMGRGSWLMLLIAISGWLAAVIGWHLFLSDFAEVRFRADIAIGHSQQEVQRAVGTPDIVVTTSNELNSKRLSSYMWSQRPIHKAALVYFRFGHAVFIYVGDDGYIESVYWAPRR